MLYTIKNNANSLPKLQDSICDLKNVRLKCITFAKTFKLLFSSFFKFYTVLNYYLVYVKVKS